MIESPIFTPFNIGPVTLRNRIIRSAAFENMAYGNRPSQDLYGYLISHFLSPYTNHRRDEYGGLLQNRMRLMRGAMPLRTLAHYMDMRKFWWLRALIRDTDFVNKLQSGAIDRSPCGHSNYCIGRMYTLEMKCNRCVAELPGRLRREVEAAEERWK